MVKVIQGNLDGSKLKIGIIVSRFNDLISKGLLDGAIDCLKRHGTKDNNITVVRISYFNKNLCEFLFVKWSGEGSTESFISLFLLELQRFLQ